METVPVLYVVDCNIFSSSVQMELIVAFPWPQWLCKCSTTVQYII